MAAAWITPLFARAVAGASGLPIGLITIVDAVWAGDAAREQKSATSVIVAERIAQA